MQKRFKKDKKGQVTIFIIIAILIVAVVAIIYFILPKAKITTEFDEQNPNAFIQSCLKDKIQDTIDIVSSQGGSVEPENYFVYQGAKIEYLCYQTEYYKTCVIQQPMLRQHIENEIKNEIQEDVTRCFNELKNNYEKKNYNVQMQTGNTKIELLPKRVVASFDYVLTLTKGSTKRYNSFNVVLNNNLYELIGIANSILTWEALYGEAEITTYMTYYRDLKVEKRTQTDGTKIYILTDRNSGNKFQFASRSIAWPSGYGNVAV